MRIAIVSTSDTKGGAARASYRLHAGFRRRGLDSRIFVAERYSADPAVVQAIRIPARRLTRRFLWYRDLPPNMIKTWSSRPPGFGIFSDHRYPYSKNLPRLLAGLDIINLHWVARFLDYPTFFNQLAGRVPLVWTLHDKNPFTGGCHIDDGCGKYRDICTECPQLGPGMGQDKAREVWQAKNQLFSALNPHHLHLISPSNWLAGQAAASSLFARFPISVIPNGLDTDRFRPVNKTEARQILGIPQEARVVLFAANALHSRHKGFSYLVDALNALDDLPGLLLLTVGKGTAMASPSYAVRSLGAVAGEEKMAQVYSAADLFVAPFSQDNLPNTIMEALACGTPAVGFRAGGIPDMIDPGENGLLVESGDHLALAAAIKDLFANPGLLREMGLNSRRKALQEYASAVQVARYLELYAKLQRER